MHRYPPGQASRQINFKKYLGGRKIWTYRLI